MGGDRGSNNGGGGGGSCKLQALLHQFAAHHMQTALQLIVAEALCSLLVFVRPITFPLACQSGVFVVVLHLLLVRDHHVGTLLLSATGLLGAVWAGIAAAGILVTITLQIPSRAGHLAVVTAAASLGFAIISCVRVSNQPFRVTLQAANLLMTFGMSVVLALWASTTAFLWNYLLAHMLLSFVGAALGSLLSGLLVLPSLATEAAIQAVATALSKTGQTGSLCVSILLRPQQQEGTLLGTTSSLAQHSQQQQQQQANHLPALPARGASTAGSTAARSSFAYTADVAGDGAGGGPQQPNPPGLLAAPPAAPGSSTAPAALAAAAAAAAGLAGPASTVAVSSSAQQPADASASGPSRQGRQQQQQQHGPFADPARAPGHLQQQPSLLEEVPDFVSHPSAELDRMGHLTQPEHWGLCSFVMAAASSSNSSSNRSSSAPAQQQQQQDQCGRAAVRRASEAAAAAAIAAAAAVPVPWPDGHAASEAAAAAAVDAEDEEDADALLQAEHEEANVGSWWDQHKPLLLQRLHHLPHHLHLPHLPTFQHPHQRTPTTHKQQREQSAARKQQQQQQQARQEAERHLFMRLSRGVDHIRPLLAEARLLHEAVMVEQAGWLRWLTTGPPAWPAWQPWARGAAAAAGGGGSGGGGGAAGPLPVASWVRLVDALQALLERTAALEGMLDEGPGAASLASLAAYPALRSTCSVIFAQTAALCGSLAAALQQHLEQRRHLQRGPLVWLARTVVALLTRRCCRMRQGGGVRSDSAAEDPVVLGFSWAASKQRQLAVLHCETQQYFADLAAARPGRPFKLDPARSTVSLMFFFSLTLAVIEAAQELQEAGQAMLYGGAAAAAGPAGPAAGAGEAAGAAAPSAAARAAAPAGEAAAAAARGAGDGAAATAAESVRTGRTGSSSSEAADAAAPPRPAAFAVTAAPLVQVGSRQGLPVAVTAAARELPLPTVVSHSVSDGPAAAHQIPAALPTSAAAAAAASGKLQQLPNSSSPSLGHELALPFSSSNPSSKDAARKGHSVGSQPSVRPGGRAYSSNALLLEVLLCCSIWGRLRRALCEELPAALMSWQGLQGLLSKRRFQAGVKLWLASSVGLVAAVVLAVVLPGLPPSVAMFGFMALVFTMKERVESSVEMVIMRVAMTVVGACVGHALMFSAATAYQPALLAVLLCMVAFSLAPLAAGQFRLMLTLLVTTLNSMILCQYTGCCGGVGSVTYFVGRILATGGGCLFAMLLNRALWPWYRNR